MKNSYKLFLVIALLFILTIVCCGCSLDNMPEVIQEMKIEQQDAPIIDYQIEIVKEERINVYDKDGNSLGTTSLDSIAYWIEKDNL